jgi:hypothetical protein
MGGVGRGEEAEFALDLAIDAFCKHLGIPRLSDLLLRRDLRCFADATCARHEK